MFSLDSAQHLDGWILRNTGVVIHPIGCMIDVLTDYKVLAMVISFSEGGPYKQKNKHIILVLPLKNSWWRSCSIVLMQQKRPLSCELEQRSLFEKKKSILLEKLFKFALTPSANGRAKKIINQGRFFCPGSWWPLYPGWKQGSLVRACGGGRADGGVLWVEEDIPIS